MSKDLNADFNGHYLNGKTKTNKNYPGGKPNRQLDWAGQEQTRHTGNI